MKFRHDVYIGFMSKTAYLNVTIKTFPGYRPSSPRFEGQCAHWLSEMEVLEHLLLTISDRTNDY